MSGIDSIVFAGVMLMFFFTLVWIFIDTKAYREILLFKEGSAYLSFIFWVYLLFPLFGAIHLLLKRQTLG